MMAQTTLLILTVALFAGIANGLVLPKQEDPQLYYLTGLDGGVLTAYPGPEGDGHAYPAAGHVLNEALVEGNKSQHWAISDGFENNVYLLNQAVSWNEVHVYFICEDCFPVDNYYVVVEAETPGVVYLTTILILDDKESCLQNNGLNQRISFGPCDFTEGSASQWKIVPVPAEQKQ